MGGEPSYRLEGRSLLPLLHQGEESGQSIEWREFVVSELDISDRGARATLNLPHDRCWSVMIRTEEWKYIAFDGFAPMLFCLTEDPQEQTDLGRKARADMSPAQIHQHVGGANRELRGTLIGYWAEEDLPLEVQEARGNNE